MFPITPSHVFVEAAGCKVGWKQTSVGYAGEAFRFLTQGPWACSCARRHTSGGVRPSSCHFHMFFLNNIACEILTNPPWVCPALVPYLCTTTPPSLLRYKSTTAQQTPPSVRLPSKSLHPKTPKAPKTKRLGGLSARARAEHRLNQKLAAKTTRPN